MTRNPAESGDAAALAHEPHHGNHSGYACGLSGPHCWTCSEPWPCRASRGLTADPSPIVVWTLLKLREFGTISADQLAHPEETARALIESDRG